MELVASLSAVGELGGAGEHGGDWAGVFGVDLSAGVVGVFEVAGADAVESVVGVEHALAEAAAAVGGVQPVGFDPVDDPGAADFEAEPVDAMGVVGDPGEGDGGVGVPADGEELTSDLVGVAGDGSQRVDRADVCVEAGDAVFGVADLVVLCETRGVVGALGAFEAGDGGGEGGEFDVALIAGRDRGDRGVLLGW